MTKIAILSDIHSPYQDNKSVELACKPLQTYSPDRVYSRSMVTKMNHGGQYGAKNNLR